VYFNYKSYSSTVLQGVVDAAYKFTITDVGGYGKLSDEGRFCSFCTFDTMRNKSRNILPNTCLPPTNSSLPIVCIGDEAYPLFANLLKPYSGENLDPDAVFFNKQLSRACKTNERAFDILYSKWHIFSKAIETNEKQLTKSWKPHVLQNAISEKEWNMNWKIQFTFQLTFPLCLHNIQTNIPYFLAHKMHHEFFARNFRKK